ncbi:MAG: ABC transporter ATP-binding protein [Alphaproteobacteria bacterium]|jgi:lipoprotein-releasing system ATP-binding protein|nr:ABC transporter ATP-binding protein [Alphaproteobacteria bacterium]MBT5828205.1 ABC transporter ATP-binding protein [Alphaproteobacteria bacterium]
MSNIIEITNLSKIFKEGDSKLAILKNIELNIKKGEDLAIVGPSGCGKTTLLQIIGLLDSQTSGELKFLGQNITKSNDKIKTNLRKKNIGFIYQFHHLMPEFTALENAIMPLLINGVNKKEAIIQGKEMLANLGLAESFNKRPSKLSGGEKQRVAVARGMIHKPDILLADEPTGNLDPENAHKIFEMFLTQVKKAKQTTIIVTHNLELAKKLSKSITIKSGKIARI